LGSDEVKEVQARLKAFGFYPGPADGIVGVLTQNAALRYQQARGQPQEGTIDRSLLEQLRQDSRPPATQHRAAKLNRANAARGGDPLDRVGQWFRSLFR
jgi:N-acetylmuramoyl-L-alanine amidase